MPHPVAMDTGENEKLIISFYQRTMILEVERLDEDCDNLEQRGPHGYLQKWFKLPMLF